MSKNPVLVLQPRRLGDLILTFHLLRSLQYLYPGHPLWVMGQGVFYEPLLPFAPTAAFLPPEQLSSLASREFSAVINLGGGELTANFTGQVKAALKLGQCQTNGSLHVNGHWQLYREGLTQNNRHNVFHWADLFRLDLAMPKQAASFRAKAVGSGRIGLFVGASEPAKRPGAQFWASLAMRLADMGFKPVLLGGPAEARLGAEIMAKGAKAANFCAKTNLNQLAGILKSLDLLITPDTGPMHLADWLAVPVLNISMGNVNAAETGPFSPGQHILRPIMSCIGCWRCTRASMHCRNAFLPQAVAETAANLAQDKPIVTAPGFELLTTGRDDLGLYRLSGQKPTARTCLDDFWQAGFLYFNDPAHEERIKVRAKILKETYPAVAASMRANFAKMLGKLATTSKRGQSLPADFWKTQPWHSRLFAGNLQMDLQNSGNTAVSRNLGRIDYLQALLA